MRKSLQTLRKRIAQLRAIRDRFGTLIAKEQRLLWLGGVAMVVETICLLGMSFPLRYLTDVLLAPNEKSNDLLFVPTDFYLNATAEEKQVFLLIVCGAVLALATLIGMFGYLRTVWCATAGQRIVMKLRKQLYGHLHRLSLRFHQDHRLGDLLVRITGDIPMLRDILSGAIIDLLGRVALVVGWFTLLLLIDARLALVSAGVLVVIGLLSTLFSKRIVKIVKRQRKQEGILAYTTNETLGSLTLVKALGREDEVTRRFARKNRTSMRAGLKGTRLQASLSRYVEILLAAGLAIVIYFGVGRVLAAAMSPGALLQFISALRNLNKPIRRVSRISTQIGKAAACGERINEVLDIQPEEVDAPDAVPAPALAGKIEFREVSFAYGSGESLRSPLEDDLDDEELEDDEDHDEAEDALLSVGLEPDGEDDRSNSFDSDGDEDSADRSRSGAAPPLARGNALTAVSLSIEPGESVALVGRNGAGKSTITNLLLRLFEPTEGAILLDDVPAPAYTIRSIRDQISIALQGTYLFGSTIRENLLFSAPDATDEEIERVLRLVGADFIETLPLGLETELAEGGANLSGGQRRKLTLAGAFLRRTPILVLDEPTAAIDQASRDDLIAALPAAIEGRTTILVAHDTALLQTADRVIHLEDGEVLAEGSHEELRATSRRYRALFPEAIDRKGAAR